MWKINLNCVMKPMLQKLTFAHKKQIAILNFWVKNFSIIDSCYLKLLADMGYILIHNIPQSPGYVSWGNCVTKHI